MAIPDPAAGAERRSARLAPPIGWVEDPDTPMTEAGPSNGDSRSVTNSSNSGGKILRPNPLKYGALRTGICYDVRMRFHATVDEDDMHPEDPRRIYEIYKALCMAGLIDDPTFTGVVKRNDIMAGIRAREATMAEALLVHTQEHWDFLEGTKGRDHGGGGDMTGTRVGADGICVGLGLKELQDLSRDGDSVYFNAESFFCSRLSCGGAIETCDAVMSGKVKNAIAVIRPPGHHAEPHKAMGFCLFNNVCVATKAVQQKYKDKCKKVLILDWFVPHVSES